VTFLCAEHQAAEAATHRPLLQIEIRDARGLVAFTGFEWPGKLLCENSM
jgi:hypothetical protein